MQPAPYTSDEIQALRASIRWAIARSGLCAGQRDDCASEFVAEMLRPKTAEGWRKLPQARRTAYLNVSATHHVARFQRIQEQRNNREIPWPVAPDEDGHIRLWEPVDMAPGPEAAAITKDELRIVAAALSDLSPWQRTVMEMRFSRKMSVREIVDITGKSAEAVRRGLCDARKRLSGVMSVVRNREYGQLQ